MPRRRQPGSDAAQRQPLAAEFEGQGDSSGLPPAGYERPSVVREPLTRALFAPSAARLGTSTITVKVHRGKVMHKMRASSLPDLVRMGERLGLDEKS